MMISVIVPVYNAGKFLNDCIKSILTSTYKNYELILINDGSTDGSGEICDDYAKLYPDKIKVFHQPNSGAVSAVDKGIGNAQGEKLVFIDSDDWVEGDYLSQLVEQSNGVDLLAVSCHTQKSNGEFVASEVNKIGNGVLSRQEILANKIVYYSEQGSIIANSRCFKIVKREIAQKASEICNENIKIGEDMQFTIACLTLCEKIKVNNDIKGYYYRYNPSSAMNSYSNNLAEKSMELIDSEIAILKDYATDELRRQFLQIRLSFLAKAIANEFVNGNKKEIKVNIQNIVSIAKAYDFTDIELGGNSKVQNMIIKCIKQRNVFKLNCIVKVAKIKNKIRELMSQKSLIQ